MALIIKDRVRETTSTSGTATYQLGGATTGFEGFLEIGTGNTTYYCCTDGTSFEIGIGTFTDASPDTLARTTILQAKDVANSTTDQAVNWADTSAKDIFCTLPSDKLIFKDENNDAVIKSPDGAILTLQTSDTTVLDGDTLGEIHFQAPDEADGAPVNDKIARIKTSVHNYDLGEILGHSVYTQFEFIVKGNFLSDPAPDLVPLLIKNTQVIVNPKLTVQGFTTSHPIVELHNQKTAIANGDTIGELEFQAPEESDDGVADNVLAKLTVDANEDFDNTHNSTSMGIHLPVINGNGTGTGNTEEYFRFTSLAGGKSSLNIGSAGLAHLKIGAGLDGTGTSSYQTILSMGSIDISGTGARSGTLNLSKKGDTSVQATEPLGTIRAKATGDTDGGDADEYGAMIQFVAEADFTATANPTAISFSTTTSGAVDDSFSRTDERLRINTNGVNVTGNLSVSASGSEDVFINSGGLKLRAGKTIMFEGATNDFNETFLDVVDPTSDRTIKLPNASGTVGELLIASGSVSDVASIDFNNTIITTDFIGYRIELRNLKSATDNTSGYIKFGINNSPTTVSNYRYRGDWVGGYYNATYNSGMTATTSSSNTQIVLNANTYNKFGNANGENAFFNIMLPNASSTTCYKLLLAEGMNFGGYPMWQSLTQFQGMLYWSDARDVPLNYFTFYLSSGNIASADYRVFGVV